MYNLISNLHDFVHVMDTNILSNYKGNVKYFDITEPRTIRVFLIMKY